MTNVWLRAAGCFWLLTAMLIAFVAVVAAAVNANAIVVLGPLAAAGAALGVAVVVNRPWVGSAAKISIAAASVLGGITLMSVVRSDEAFKAVVFAVFPAELVILVTSVLGLWRLRKSPTLVDRSDHGANT